MGRIVNLPPDNQIRDDGTSPGGWWHEVPDGRLVCDLCPRECKLQPGDRGFCFVRQNRDGEMVLTTYGKSTGFCIDPIEKKPLNQFYPGTSVLSFGTAGCNLGCKFCQNHDISKARKTELLSEQALPDAIARAAVEWGCKSVAFTYNDPIIWAEYAIDTAKACHDAGVQAVAVTAGYISAAARAPFFQHFDAANIDLKAFSEDFYEKVTLSHLQPILETLVWLKQETNVWFEITNLLIPDLNDSATELKQLCDWVLEHLGDTVPVHFSAFHPDYRMLDRPRTPHETLVQAHEIAKSCGLRHAYVGNVHDPQRQSTYCDGCGKRVIERDWYQLGEYQLDHRGSCRHCGHQLSGRYASAPGSWGRKRQPVQISQFIHADDLRQSASHRGSASPTLNSKAPNTMPPIQPENTGSAIVLDPEQQTVVHRAACQAVASAIRGETPSLSAATLSGVGSKIVDGVYVSLKRQSQLRGCCGFTGRRVSLLEGMQYAATRTALHDPRFPPVANVELPFLTLEVWLLGGLIPVTAKGSDRVDAIEIGRDGLVIQRGEHRGLLLPGVATDHDWDPEAFLRHLCVKANLPPTAWRENDTILHRFEGTVVKDGFASTLAVADSFQGVVNQEVVQRLATFCLQNVRLLSSGALPNYFLPDVTDGMVNGIVLVGTWGDSKQVTLMKKSLRAPMPLQSTLFTMCEELVTRLTEVGVDPNTVSLDLAVLENPAMHGTTSQPDLRGIENRRSLVLQGPGAISGLNWDPDSGAEKSYGQIVSELGLRSDQISQVLSFITHATSRINLANKPSPVLEPEIRPPAMDGRFYPADPSELAALVRGMWPQQAQSPTRWRAAMIPHAGLKYSGQIAAEVLGRIEFPKTIIVIGPKHTRRGCDWAIAPHAVWQLPGIEFAGDLELAKRLAGNIEHLELDASAHAAEHCIEVEIPYLHHAAPNAKLVGIAVGTGDLDACRTFAAELAETLQDEAEDVLLLISSDMNHFATDAETRRLDELALQAIETLDVQNIYDTVRRNEISMCGLLPAVIVLEALQRIRPLEQVERVAYATSAEVSNDLSRVVGYAGMLFR